MHLSFWDILKHFPVHQKSPRILCDSGFCVNSFLYIKNNFSTWVLYLFSIAEIISYHKLGTSRLHTCYLIILKVKSLRWVSLGSKTQVGSCVPFWRLRGEICLLVFFFGFQRAPTFLASQSSSIFQAREIASSSSFVNFSLLFILHWHLLISAELFYTSHFCCLYQSLNYFSNVEILHWGFHSLRDLFFSGEFSLS